MPVDAAGTDAAAPPERTNRRGPRADDESDQGDADPDRDRKLGRLRQLLQDRPPGEPGASPRARSPDTPATRRIMGAVNATFSPIEGVRRYDVTNEM